MLLGLLELSSWVVHSAHPLPNQVELLCHKAALPWFYRCSNRNMAHEMLECMVHSTAAGGTSVFKRITMIILLENVTTFPLELKRRHKTQHRALERPLLLYVWNAWNCDKALRVKSTLSLRHKSLKIWKLTSFVYLLHIKKSCAKRCALAVCCIFRLSYMHSWWTCTTLGFEVLIHITIIQFPLSISHIFLG